MPLWAEGPVIEHSAVACMVAERFPKLEARFGDPDAVSRARVQFRGEAGPWYFVAMKREGAVFTGTLPKPKSSLKKISYYIEATDRQFRENRTQEFAADVVPQAALCADKMTDSMKYAIGETNRRRGIQSAYNQENGITPETITKHLGELLSSVYEADYVGVPEIEETPEERYRSIDEIEKEIKALEKTMREAAKALEFERAAQVRDRIKNLRSKEFGLK
jgi:hypothetical protein